MGALGILAQAVSKLISVTNLLSAWVAPSVRYRGGMARVLYSVPCCCHGVLNVSYSTCSSSSLSAWTVTSVCDPVVGCGLSLETVML